MQETTYTQTENRQAIDGQINANNDKTRPQLNVGIDMGKNMWMMGVYNLKTGRYSHYTFKNGAPAFECYMQIDRLVKAGNDVHVVYEAGLFGNTPARMIEALGAKCTILPVGKLEVVKTGGKNAKTDKIDTKKMATKIDPRSPETPSVYVPTIPEEVRRCMLQEIKRLDLDIKRNNNRIGCILVRWPVLPSCGHQSAAKWREELEKVFKADYVPKKMIPEMEVKRIENMVVELEVLERNRAAMMAEIEKEDEKKRAMALGQGKVYAADEISQFRGIGDVIARSLDWRIGDWSRFSSGKKLASYFGLTPVPWASCTMQRNQGISKEGNPELRRMAIQAAWLWSKWQPESALTKKWKERLATKGRTRKTAIVAMARQLVVAIHGLIVHGREIPGAIKNRTVRKEALA